MNEPAPTRYASFRDGFAAIRELLIVLAMLSLLFTPQAVRRLLNEAGIRSLAGIEFDEQAIEDVEVADLRIKEIENQLAEAQYELANMSRSTDRAADPRLQTVSKLLNKAQLKAIETEATLDSVLKEHNVQRKLAGAPTRADRTAQHVLLPPNELFQ